MLTEEIKKDLVSAQKERNEMTVSVLRMLIAAIVNKQKDKRLHIAAKYPLLSETELDEQEELADEETKEVLASEMKKRRDSVASFEKGGRNDLAEKEKEEIEIIKKYLPPEMSEEEIRLAVKEAIAKVKPEGPQGFGAVMKELVPKTRGRADGFLVSKIVKEEMNIN
ncbi:MAG: GatB/YqeY domain-containing protein [Candidatus Pacebacteria bacterium]|nr:GatB/YqeY domain-containing protein [Candidatus Paceibacterota bacterium]